MSKSVVRQVQGGGIRNRKALLVGVTLMLALVGGTAVARFGSAASDSPRVGELRKNGLRIDPSGSNTAAAVMDPAQFPDSATQHAYTVATKIPAVLNKLYCWCRCEDRGTHRSNLQCFEDQMGADCDVCQGTAEIAYRMTQQGVTDAGKIQAAVDAQWGPKA